MFFKKIIKIMTACVLAFCTAVFVAIAVCRNKTADRYFVDAEGTLELSNAAHLKSDLKSVASFVNNGSSDFNANIKFLGVFPVKKVTVTSTQRPEVTPGGIAFGIKMLSDGVLVASLNNFVCNNKIVCPAKDAGIRAGDVIVSINSQKVMSNSDVTTIVSKSEGKKLEMVIRRDNTERKTIVKPIFDGTDCTYKIGLSVRDSSAGIGTVTFYNEENSTFGGLGHAVCDVGETAISLYSGSVAIASIDSVTASMKGSPGRLNGHFVSNKDSGTILLNDETGVYGTLENVKTNEKSVEMAFKQEIKTGKASVITTLSGTQPQEFEIEIEQIALNSDRATKNMIVHVTDERLLSEAGGIVQGMSGSPILQNGRLVGAVTHVFVNDPTRGYAIFAENMLESARIISNNVGVGVPKSPQRFAS